MAVPLTFLHQQRVVDQIRQNLIQLQRDMLNNAAAHKQMALAQSPDIATLLGFVSDCAAQYLKRLKWVSDLRADPIREAWVLAAMTRMGWTETDLVSVFTPLKTAATALGNATLITYADVAAACDSLTAFVDVPPSLWPE
jgi:hypothetical protein